MASRPQSGRIAQLIRFAIIQRVCDAYREDCTELWSVFFILIVVAGWTRVYFVFQVWDRFVDDRNILIFNLFVAPTCVLLRVKIMIFIALGPHVILEPKEWYLLLLLSGISCRLTAQTVHTLVEQKKSYIEKQYTAFF